MEAVYFSIYWGNYSVTVCDIRIIWMDSREVDYNCRSGLSFSGNVDTFLTMKLGHHLNIFCKL